MLMNLLKYVLLLFIYEFKKENCLVQGMQN